MRSIAVLALLPMALAGGCTCGSKTAPTASNGPASSAGAPSSAARTAPSTGHELDPSVFSAPIAAARTAHQDVVAGLVAAQGIVRVLGMTDGKPAWSADAVTGVSWAPDAELHLQAAGDAGVVLVWRGPHAGKTGRVLVVVGPRGEIPAPPIDVGAAFCATADGLAWIDPRTSGPARVFARRWADAAGKPVLSVPSDRDPALACGDHAVFVLGDGDDDLTVASFVPGAAPRPPVVAIRDDDFGDDDEREHDAYTSGDDLGLVRVGSSGAVAMRTLPQGGTLAPWHKSKQPVSPDDDVVAVDGDADATLVVFTHDADDACPGIGSTAEAVRALRFDRKGGGESVVDLAPADCDRAPGPFWVAANAPGGPTVGWVERATKLAAGAPPIVGVSFRAVGPADAKPRRIEMQADAASNGGCSASACLLGALVRPPGGDGMQPETLTAFAY